MTEPAIDVSELRFAWSRQVPVILDIPTFSISPGEAVFLKGPSGSGKTTLLNLIGGVTTPLSGTVSISGRDIGGLRPAQRDRLRADHIGFVFQLFNLVPYLGLVDNTALPCRFSARRRAAAEDSGGVESEANRLLTLMGLDLVEMTGRPVSELSVGQQQRVAAARALIGQPDLIIADEPTSALDDDTGIAFLNLLLSEARARGAAVLFVSHDQRLANAFDRVVSLADINRAA